MRMWEARNKKGNVTFTDEAGTKLLIKSVPGDADYHGNNLIFKIVTPQGHQSEVVMRKGDFVQLLDAIHYWVENDGQLPTLLNSSQWLKDQAPNKER